MRILRIAVLISVLLVAGLAQAQDPNGPPGCPGGFGGPRGGGTQGGPPPSGGRGFNGARGNASFRGEPLTQINVTLDPPGPLTMAPGDTALVHVSLRNDGNVSLALNLSTGGGFRNATPLLVATVTPNALSLDPGASGVADITLQLSSDAPQGCSQFAAVRVQDADTNRSTQARIVVDVPPAPDAQPPQDAAPVVTSAGTDAAPAKSASLGFVAGIVALGGAATLARRR